MAKTNLLTKNNLLTNKDLEEIEIILTSLQLGNLSHLLKKLTNLQE